MEGGNHAQFGNYGEQKGDGKATITATEQQEQTVKLFINRVIRTNADIEKEEFLRAE